MTDAPTLQGMDGIVADPPCAARAPLRFVCEAGSDQIYTDGKPITHETAGALIEAWREQARRYRDGVFPCIHSRRLARWCDTDAEELEGALRQALNYRRCMDSHPNAYVGRGAFAESVAQIEDGDPPPCAA